MAHTYSHLFALPTTGLRFFTVYGPWSRPDMALFLITKAILDGKPIDIFNHGNMVRDFTFVDDIVEGVIRILDRTATPGPDFDPAMPDPATSNAPYRVFNIGNHQPVPLMTYIETLEQALGMQAEKRLLPMQDGDVPATSADTTELAAWAVSLRRPACSRGRAFRRVVPQLLRQGIMTKTALIAGITAQDSAPPEEGRRRVRHQAPHFEGKYCLCDN